VHFKVIGQPYGRKWNLRKLAVSGKRGQFRTQMRSMMELWTREAMAQGENVTQAIVVSDMGGFTLRVHACVVCKLFHNT